MRTVQAVCTVQVVCDDCGEAVGSGSSVSPVNLLAPILDHPGDGGRFKAVLDLCSWCSGRALEAYADADEEGVAAFWRRVAARQGWFAPIGAIEALIYQGVEPAPMVSRSGYVAKKEPALVSP